MHFSGLPRAGPGRAMCPAAQPTKVTMNPLILYLYDQHNPQGVRMILRNYQQMTMSEFIKLSMTRLDRNSNTTVTCCTDVKVITTIAPAKAPSVRQPQDLTTGDKLLFCYDAPLHTTAAATTTTTSPKKTSVKYEAVRLLFTFILFICLHQGFLYWRNSSSGMTEKERVHQKIQDLKYPNGYSNDL